MVFIYVFISSKLEQQEDSSYDSDNEAVNEHQDISRTTSETLGQEDDEYVSLSFKVSF